MAKKEELTKQQYKDIGFVNNLFGQANESPSIKVDMLFAAIITFCTLAIIWASFSEIDELARGQGKVIPAKKIQTIQNLDGGVISEILVQEGDHVVKNQPLMKIDTTRFQASLEENKENLLSLLAKKTRLQAELKYKLNDKMPKLKFPKELKYSDSVYKQTEIRLLKSRINDYKNAVRTLQFQLYQKRQELTELYAKEKQLKRSLVFIQKEKRTIEKMVKAGSKSSVELLKVQGTYNQTKGDLDAATLSIPRAKLAIAEAKSKIKEKESNFRTTAAKDLQDVESEIKKVKARLVSDNDKLSKTIVRSPVNGTIKQININTIGGVVKSGDNLIEIVPDSDILLVEAKIDPKDIAFINPNLKALVKITAYDFSIYGGLKGKIVEISADSIEDKYSKDGKAYYKIIVKTNKNYLEKDGKKLSIIPGMIATVDIITGKKTIMDFLLKPILKTKQGALHER